LNKQSIIALRIEFLQKKIDECFIDKEFVAASLLEKNLQKYIEMYKDYQAPRSPKTIVYNIQNNIHQTNVTVEQAIEEVDALVLELDKKEDY
jgi:Tfp pilus assembly protein PilN